MAKETELKLLWVDDQIGDFKPYVQILQKEGFDVDVADHSLGALEMAKQKDYDLILVDISMPKPDGIELLRRLAPIQERARLALLSSFLYLEKYRSQLAQLDFPVALLNKDFPPLHSADLNRRFVDPILNLLPKKPEAKQRDEKSPPPKVPSQANPFETPLADFMALSASEKDAALSFAREIASATLKRAFDDGQIWVFLCGSATHIRMSARSTSDIPSEATLMQFAHSQQRAPFQFFKEAKVEEGWIMVVPQDYAGQACRRDKQGRADYSCAMKMHAILLRSA